MYIHASTDTRLQRPKNTEPCGEYFTINENETLDTDYNFSYEIVNDTIGISVYDTIDKNANLICAKVADELLTISNITASFVLGNTGDKICISGRSIGDINVQVILENMRRRRSYYPCRSSS